MVEKKIQEIFDALKSEALTEREVCHAQRIATFDERSSAQSALLYQGFRHVLALTRNEQRRTPRKARSRGSHFRFSLSSA